MRLSIRPAGLACLLGLAPALVAEPAASADVQRLGRYLIHWPTVRTLQAGDRITVSASPASPSRAPWARPVAVVQRLSQRTGRPVALIARRRLGRRALRVALRRPGSYRVVVASGRARRHRDLTVEPSVSPPPASPRPSPCITTSPLIATLSVNATRAHPGDALSAHLTNTGASCWATGWGASLQHEVDGAWTDVPSAAGEPAILVFVQPGQSRDSTVTIPADASPGHYRLVEQIDSFSPYADAPLTDWPHAVVVSPEVSVG